MNEESPLLEASPISNHRRSESTVLEDVLDSLVDVKDSIVETAETVLEEVHSVIQQPGVAEPVLPRESGDHDKRLGVTALAVLVFYKVSGGPFGVEPTVKAGGPLVALLGFILFPLLWSLQEALVTAELGSTFPEPSGSVAWVEEAFGSKAGLLSGYFHWVSGATDNAIYPSLFLNYVASYVHQDMSDTLMRFAFTVCITIILALINYSGLEIVGKLSIAVCIISMSPFIVMTILAIPKLEPGRWLQGPAAGVTTDDDLQAGFFPDPAWGNIMWRPLLNNLFWNLNSFDVGASFAGEVQDPERVFPRAMFLSIVFVVFSYLIPLLAALGSVETEQCDWSAGYFTNLTVELGGNWLGAWMIFAAAISNIALFQAELSGDAYQLMGMADRGMIPKIFTKRSRFGTPENGILLGTAVIILMSVADFDALVEMLNFAYSISLLMEFGAFIKLRIAEPEIDRPYRIPFNTAGCVCFLLPPTCFLFFLMSIASKMTYIYFTLLGVLGVVMHWFQKLAHHYDVVEYTKAPKRKKASVGV